MNEFDIQDLLNEFQTPFHVRAHCEQVGRLSKELAQAHQKAGHTANSELAETAGRIHDFVRVVDFKELPLDLGDAERQQFWRQLRQTHQGQHHAKVGEAILQERGLTELASIVGRHHFGAINSPEPPTTLEEKIVFYTDKRVSHDQVVSLEERLREAHQRHIGPNQPLTEKEKNIHQKIRDLETELFTDIPLKPQDLK